MSDVPPIVAGLDAELRRAGTASRAEAERRYLHSALRHYGVPVPTIRALVVGACRQHPNLTRDEVRELTRALWAEPVHERRMAAIEVLTQCNDRLAPRDLALVERLVRGSGTWALVDGLAANVAGGIVVRFPEDARVTQRLARWAADVDFWLRRSALLAELRWLRAGGSFDRFAGHAESMLADREFFIRKAIGWVLRETAKTRPDEVSAWLAPRAHLASGVTLREAVKPMGDATRAAVLAGKPHRGAEAGPVTAAKRP